ncbi:MAG: FKBP-type peptidyl-prolyl cis-trans isomerase [Agathobacter sp.]|nr:FKBP-type peptidyl-prolyl cis-trans isomerase [Agathobacter sp.]
MKKKFLLTGICAAMILSLAACGENAQKKEEQVSQDSQGSGTSSIEMNIDPEAQVKSLCDYSAINVTLQNDYTITDEDVEENVRYILEMYGLGTVEVTDRDTIQEGDIVNVDYTGYWNGEAFDNGSAEGAMLTISKDSGYVPGFVEGLVGEKVGTTVRKDVTFPKDYELNPDLAGQLTTFEYKINGIYREADYDEIPDETIAENFGDLYGLTTVEGLVDYMRSYLEQSVESSKTSEAIDLIKDYVVANSTVEIPEDYLAQRVEEYKESFIEDYITEETDLETYLSENYSMTLDDAMAEWKTYEEEQITVELLFRRIAQLEGIEIDEEEYAEFIQNFLSSSTAFTDEETMYEYFGSGNKENGETYLRQLYITNKAIDLVYSKATISEKPAESESSESTESTESTEATESTEQ